MTPNASTNKSEGYLLRSSASTDDLDALDLEDKLPVRLKRRQSTWLELPKSFRIQSSWHRSRMLLSVLGACVILLLFGTYWHLQKTRAEKSPAIFVKPEGFKIVGLIFFGRPDRVAILDCYLKRNLVENGGFLDEVHWVANTKNEHDLQYLDELIPTSASYSRINLPELGFENVWEHAIESSNLYIKIDDDVVYAGPEAIPKIVYTKLNHPKSFVVSANVINSPVLGWLHYHLGAIRAYLPELSPPSADTENDSGTAETWRASELPNWQGPENFTFPLVDKGDAMFGGLKTGESGAPPFDGHRWLPLKQSTTEIYRTPIAKVEYAPWGTGWTSWAIAAQQHYSFLEHLEKGMTKLYHFGTGKDAIEEGIWDASYTRLNINFLAIWGYDVLSVLPIEGSDEEYLTVDAPKKLGRPALVNTHAIVAHFSFSSQTEVMRTDLLSRYRAYARENVCSS